MQQVVIGHIPKPLLLIFLFMNSCQCKSNKGAVAFVYFFE